MKHIYITSIVASLLLHIFFYESLSFLAKKQMKSQPVEITISEHKKEDSKTLSDQLGMTENQKKDITKKNNSLNFKGFARSQKEKALQKLIDSGRQELNRLGDIHSSSEVGRLPNAKEVAFNKSQGEKPCIGLKYSGFGIVMGEELRSKPNFKLVRILQPGGPAEKFGLKVGDYIDQNIDVIKKMKTGSSLSVTYFRDGKFKEITLVSEEICFYEK